MTRFTFVIVHKKLKVSIISEHDLETQERAEQIKQRIEEELGDGYEINYYEDVGGPFPV